MKVDKLDELIKSGTIKSYGVVNVDNDGVEGKKSKFRNTERLHLVFPDGKRLVVDAFCSGCLEDITLSFS
jgi:hypothetical protein